MRRNLPTRCALLGLVLALVLLPAGAAGAESPPPRSPQAPVPTAAMEAAAACPGQSWSVEPRPAEHEVVVERDLPIEMSDGTVLLADLHLPDADGPFPTIVTTTPYGKNALGPEAYFPERGYAHLVVDVRGTGASQGEWRSFDVREQTDIAEAVEWAAAQDWSTGDVGMYGASYLAITQLFAAAQRPEPLKALFPIVPAGDSYRDIVFVGGQMNLAFIPLWLGLVTGVSLLPGGSLASDPAFAAQVVAEHLVSATEFQGPLVADAAQGGQSVYDGEFWRTRSPLEVVDRIDVPVFMTGGLNDLFQRGEPMLYERMKDNTLVKFLQGPWGHLDGSTGAGLPADGVPPYVEIATAWFDRWVRGVDNDAECLPDVTLYHWIAERYEVVPDWPHPDLTPQRFYLRDEDALSVEAPDGEEAGDQLPQVYGNGACSRSTSQWLMGAADRTPCQTDNRATELAELTYTTPPFEEETLLNGPIAAKLHVTTTAQEAVVVARLTAVAPDGRSRELSTGILSASFRALDEDRSRIVDGHNLQPWHPYTEESVLPVTPGEPMAMDVEIFPTVARIPAGWSLRLSIGTSDFPHAVSPLPAQVAQMPGVLTVLHDAEHPSSVTVPFVAAGGDGGGAGGVVPAAPAGSEAGTAAGDAGSGDGAGATLPATGGGTAAVAAALLLGALGLVRRRAR